SRLECRNRTRAPGRGPGRHKPLVETQLAVSADAGDPTLRDPSLFEITATPRPGVALADLEKAALAQLERLKNEDVTDEELRRARNQIEADFIYQRDSVTQQAERLGYQESVTGWRYLETYLDRIRALTPADIRRGARQYFPEANRTVGC